MNHEGQPESLEPAGTEQHHYFTRRDVQIYNPNMPHMVSRKVDVPQVGTDGLLEILMQRRREQLETPVLPADPSIE